MIDKIQVLNRIKFAYNLKSDAELSKFLGIKPNTLSGWHKRDSMNFDTIFSICEDINLDWLITGKGEMLRNSSLNEETCLTCKAKDEVILIQNKLIKSQEENIENLKKLLGEDAKVVSAADVG